VDESTSGGGVLNAVGSPLLAEVLRSVARIIPSPLSTSSTAYDDWAYDYLLPNPNSDVPTVGTMGTGSDYTVMLDHLGIPCLDLNFNRQSKVVYPYHSNYDSFYWVDKFGDVGFKKRLAMAQLWGVLAVRMAGVKVIPFKAVEYTTVLAVHIRALALKSEICLHTIEESTHEFHIVGRQLDNSAQMFDGQDCAILGEEVGRNSIISSFNKQYMSIERAFLWTQGLPGRSWFKHIVSRDW
jgi:N-acetylated-alpha-linked acidic dipeptidase